MKKVVCWSAEIFYNMSKQIRLIERKEIIQQNRKLFDAVWLNGNHSEEAKELEKVLSVQRKYYTQSIPQKRALAGFMQVYARVLEEERYKRIVEGDYITTKYTAQHIPNDTYLSDREKIAKATKNYNEAWLFLEKHYFKQNKL